MRGAWGVWGAPEGFWGGPRGFLGGPGGVWGGLRATARSETLHHGTTRAEPGTGPSFRGEGWRGIHGERAHIYIYKIAFYFIYIYIFEGIPREREAGLQQGRASRQAPAPSFDRFGPFSHGNYHGVKRPGCTPAPPPSQIPIQMLACTSGRSTHHPKSHGTDGGASPVPT